MAKYTVFQYDLFTPEWVRQYHDHASRDNICYVADEKRGLDVSKKKVESIVESEDVY